MKQRILAALILAFGVALAGCSTVNGFGQDVERGGEAIQDAAN